MIKDENSFLYKGSKTNEISFPLGGIGTGCIGLAGNGRLIDWEIFNKPNKGGLNGFSHFAIKAERDGKVLDARILNGDLPPPYTGNGKGQFSGFGFGPTRSFLAGLPHFESVEFLGEFPIAKLDFKGAPSFPGRVSMTAFNPLIPLEDKDSSIPAAFFEMDVVNSSSEILSYSIVGVLSNPLPANNVHSVTTSDGLTLLHLSSDSVSHSDVKYGDMTLATNAGDVSYQEYWYEGAWFDQLEVYWRDLMAPGRFKNRKVAAGSAGANRQGMLAAHFDLAPGERKSVRYLISWSFPNCENYWNKTTCNCGGDCASQTWKNYYATIWPDSKASAEYAMKNWDRLYSQTLLFKDTIFASDLPHAALDAVSANISILKTPTVLRLEDGTFYGWEGCHAESGCCEGSCTHVWNYAQALPFLFPKLERSMRDADYKYNIRESGAMPFRIQLPLGAEPWSFRPCADGQFGGVMKVYRDWKISGDNHWLRELWPSVKKSIEFAWSDENEDKWDPEKSGILTGRQHHTLDMELFGPNSWLTGFYLGALKAGAEIAHALGEENTASEYLAIFERGKLWVDTHLFNGKYYYQALDITDRSILQPYSDADNVYWDAEHAEIKYQIAEGCEIDQVLAQWHANLYGLGDIFDPAQVKIALDSLFANNFRPKMRDYFNACRIFCLNDESGLVISHWPDAVYRPIIPIPYAGETMHGYEYSAAILMIQMGLVDEGTACVKAVRDRYDGERRNPWNEIECGSNYARSMASYALLNAFSGFEFDMSRNMIGFNPILTDNGSFRCFWSLDSGWGEFILSDKEAKLKLLHGCIVLSELKLCGMQNNTTITISCEGQIIGSQLIGDRIAFDRTVTINFGQELIVRF